MAMNGDLSIGVRPAGPDLTGPTGFLPLLARAEQGDGLVDAALSGIGALGGGDRVDVIALQAVGELSEEGAGLLVGREGGGEIGRDRQLRRAVRDGERDVHGVA